MSPELYPPRDTRAFTNTVGILAAIAVVVLIFAP